MKTPKAIIAILALLLFSLHSVLAVSGVRLSIETNRVHLDWTSQPDHSFIVAHRSSLDSSTPWTFLTAERRKESLIINVPVAGLMKSTNLKALSYSGDLVVIARHP